jgi:hypothetical protein
MFRAIALTLRAAFGRGYILSPLRGFGKTLAKKQEGTALLHKSEHKKHKNAGSAITFVLFVPFRVLLVFRSRSVGKAAARGLRRA